MRVFGRRGTDSSTRKEKNISQENFAPESISDGRSQTGAKEPDDVDVSILYYIQLIPLKYSSTILNRIGRRLRWFNTFKKSRRSHSTYKPQYPITSLQRLLTSVSTVSDKFALCYARTGRGMKFSFGCVKRIVGNISLTAATQLTIKLATIP